jgi:hypothetical protein
MTINIETLSITTLGKTINNMALSITTLNATYCIVFNGQGSLLTFVVNAVCYGRKNA